MFVFTQILISVAGAAVAFALAYAYQEMRFRAFEQEDLTELEHARAGSPDEQWVQVLQEQAALGLVSPSVLARASELELISSEQLEAAEHAARTYRPSVARTARLWLPLFVLASLVPPVRPLFVTESTTHYFWLLLFCLDLVAIAMADQRFRIIPLPHIALLVVAGYFAFSYVDVLAYVGMGAGTAFAVFMSARVYEMLMRRVGVCGIGDVLLLAVVVPVLLNASSALPLLVFLVALIVSSLIVIGISFKGKPFNRAAFASARVALGPAIAVATVCASVVW